MKKSGLMLVLLMGLLCTLTSCSQADTTDTTQTEEIATVLTWQEQYDLGMKYLSDGNYQEAIIAFTAAIALEPMAVAAYLGRGDAYIGSGETEENLAQALSDYSFALELDSDSVDVYAKLADVYIRQGDYENARIILQQGVKRTGDAMLKEWLEDVEQGTYYDANGVERRTSWYNSDGVLTRYEITSFPAAYQTKTQNFDGDGVLQYTTVVTEGVYGNTVGVTTYDGDGNIGMDIQTDGITAAISGWGSAPEGAPEGIGEYDSICVCYYGDGLTKEVTYVTGGIWGYSTIEYDEYGNQCTETYYDANDALLEYDTYIYDENGNMLQHSQYNAAGELDRYCVIAYDSFGRETEYAYYNGDGSYWFGNEYEYDANGNEVKRISYEEGKSLSNWRETYYDDDGNYLGSTDYNSDGSIDDYTLVEYSADGTQITNYYEGDGTLSRTVVSE